jgi:hypothetical protein
MEFLSQHGVPYEEKDIRADPEALREARALGARKTPAILVGDTLVQGFEEADLRPLLGLP